MQLLTGYSAQMPPLGKVACPCWGGRKRAHGDRRTDTGPGRGRLPCSRAPPPGQSPVPGQGPAPQARAPPPPGPAPCRAFPRPRPAVTPGGRRREGSFIHRTQPPGGSFRVPVFGAVTGALRAGSAAASPRGREEPHPGLAGPGPVRGLSHHHPQQD